MHITLLTGRQVADMLGVSKQDGAPVTPAPTPSRAPGRSTPFDPDELAAIYAEFDVPDRQLVTFARETGLRPEEWCALRRADFDRAGRRVLVQRKFAKGRLTPYPKTNRRSVPLTPPTTRSRASRPGSTRR